MHEAAAVAKRISDMFYREDMSLELTLHGILKRELTSGWCLLIITIMVGRVLLFKVSYPKT
jgi:hypothetical protein